MLSYNEEDTQSESGPQIPLPLPLAGPFKSMSNNNYFNNNYINIILEKIHYNINEPRTPIILQFPLYGTLSNLIELYKSKINDFSDNKLFLFNNQRLDLSKNLSEAGLDNNSKIIVINC